MESRKQRVKGAWEPQKAAGWMGSKSTRTIQAIHPHQSFIAYVSRPLSYGYQSVRGKVARYLTHFGQLLDQTDAGRASVLPGGGWGISQVLFMLPNAAPTGENAAEAGQ